MGRRRKSDDEAAAVLMLIIAAAILIMAAAAAAVMAIFAAFGVLYGAGLSTVNFIKLVKTHLFVRSGNIVGNAYVNYFHVHGDGVRNLKVICSKALADNMRAAGLVVNPFPNSGWFGQTISAIFKVFTAIAVFIVTVAYTPILIVALSAVFLPVWIGYLLLAIVLRLLEWVINNTYGLFNICKHCHKRVDLPIYKCPSCGAKFDKLLSSVEFGPLHIKCKCGAKLPASRFTGRNSLPAYCPHPNCGIRLSGQDATPVSIAILGGPSSGKTQLMIDMAAVLLYRVLPDLKLSYTIPADHRPEIDRLLRMFKDGVTPQITRDAMIEAVCVEVKASSWRYPQRLYFYDPPGESFSAVNKVSQHKYYANMLGAVFVLDPSTLEEVLKDYERNGKVFQIGQRGAMRPEDGLERWLMSMDRDFPGIVGKSTCTVVINKIDEPSFYEITGLKAGASDQECRRFLEKYGCVNLIKTLDNSFKKVEFFAATFVGDGGNGNPFKPSGLSQLLRRMLQLCFAERLNRNIRHILSLIWKPTVCVGLILAGTFIFMQWYSDRLVVDTKEWRWPGSATVAEKAVLQYFRNRKYETQDASFSDIRTSNPEVSYYLACLYDSGQPRLHAYLGKDDEKAFGLYKFAAELGYAPAMVNLALMFAEGRGCVKDAMQARKLCNDAIAVDYPRAYYVMGVNFRDGLWSNKSLSMAESYFKKGASKGCLAARAALGEIYLEGADGVKKNVQKGLKFLTQAAENGEPMAQASLGSLYLRKDGPVLRDASKAEYWLKQSAYRACPSGLSALGAAYLTADEFSGQRGDALFFLGKAANKGDLRAARLLGLVHEKGYKKGDFKIQQDLQMSLKWFRIAQSLDSDCSRDVERVKSTMLQSGFSKADTMTDDERRAYEKKEKKRRLQEEKEATVKGASSAIPEGVKRVEEDRGVNQKGNMGSRSRRSCFRCAGLGKVSELKSCWRCNGTAVIDAESDCKTCDGKGVFKRRVFCTKCSGRGKVLPQCSVCNNTRKVKCWNCNGKGGQYQRPERQGIGGRYMASRKVFVKCTTCGGRGKESCSSCSGYLDECSACRGAGAVVQSYPCGDCSGHGVRSHKEPCDNGDCSAGFVLARGECPSCRGKGKIPDDVNEAEDRMARTKNVMGELRWLIERYKKAYDRENPPERLQDLGILKIGVVTKDGWGRELSFNVEGNSYEIISAGEDGRFATDDDLSVVYTEPDAGLEKIKHEVHERVEEIRKRAKG